jgi:hypothetical protein
MFYYNSIKFIKKYLITTCVFSFYGFTRGYRSDNIFKNDNKKYIVFNHDASSKYFMKSSDNKLISQKLINGFKNAVKYSIPLYNLKYINTFIQRVFNFYNPCFYVCFNSNPYYEIDGYCPNII